MAPTGEPASRFVKALALADIADAAGLTPADTALLDEREWDLLAAAARTKKPSPQTQRLTILMLQSRTEARRALNPPERGIAFHGDREHEGYHLRTRND
jgi:hypothetical protein